ncbi:MAG: hypothetical protein IKQ53_01270, partial [Bacteroidales bacterium]|nr:hypothetical protein [Bacteroidales bacterium]
VVQYMYNTCTIFVRLPIVQVLYKYCTYIVQRTELVRRNGLGETNEKRGRHRLKQTAARGPIVAKIALSGGLKQAERQKYCKKF